MKCSLLVLLSVDTLPAGFGLRGVGFTRPSDLVGPKMRRNE